jgi:hypothetical protein
MVGDLVEIQERKGLLWFWLSVSGVALSLVWRRPLAFIAALIVGSKTWQFFAFPTMLRMMHDHLLDHDHSTYPWLKVFLLLVVVVGSLFVLSFYAAIRYGLRERTTQMALVWTAICAVTFYFSGQPIVLALCIGAALCFMVASLWSSKWRMESLVVLAAVAISGAVNFLFDILSMLYQQFSHRGPWYAQDYQGHPSLMWVSYWSYILCLLVVTSAWSYLRDWLMRRQSLESRREML